MDHRKAHSPADALMIGSVVPTAHSVALRAPPLTLYRASPALFGQHAHTLFGLFQQLLPPGSGLLAAPRVAFLLPVGPVRELAIVHSFVPYLLPLTLTLVSALNVFLR